MNCRRCGSPFDGPEGRVICDKCCCDLNEMPGLSSGMRLKRQLTEYFALQKSIHEYFGYVEDWVTIPLSDETDYYWRLTENGHGGGFVEYSSEPIETGIEGEYRAAIYTQRFLPKWVYRGNGFTMISADTQCDGNKYLMVFDNEKESK